MSSIFEKIHIKVMQLKERSQKICLGCTHFEHFHGSAGFCKLKGLCCKDMIDGFESCHKFKRDRRRH